MGGPLSGIRVLDLSRAIAGPYGTMIMGDLGAEVIKIEPPEGDISRFSAGPDYNGENFFYMAFNRNKKGLVIDPGTKSGSEAFYDLVKVSDVVWDNFRPGVMDRLGADYNKLKKINPKIICSSISGYGTTGPGRDRPAYDVVILAAAGVLGLTRESEGSTPIRPAVPVADMAGGLFGVIGVLAALAERERTGKGQQVSISLLNSCLSLLSYHLSYYFCSGEVPKPLGHSGHTVSVPYGIYATKDGYVAIGSCWPRIARAIGAEWLIEDSRFNEMEARRMNRDELNRIVEEHLVKAGTDEWLHIFEIEDIAAGKVRSLNEVIADPQVVNQNMLITIEHALGGKIKLAGNPVKAINISEDEYTPPPVLNQHADEIMSGLLGYSQEKIIQLRNEEQSNSPEHRTHVRKER